MAAVALVGAVCSGHDCFAPRANIASNNTTFFVEGRAALLVGDPWSQHICGEAVHGGIIASGSSNFFIAGRSVARLGDGIAGDSGPCGSLIAAGVATTFFCAG